MAFADQPFFLKSDQIQFPRYSQADKEDYLFYDVRAAEKNCFGSCQNIEGPWILSESTIGSSVRNQDLIHGAATYNRRSKQEPFFFRGQMHVHLLIFLLLPILLLSFTASSLFNHSIDTSRCYETFNILLSVISRSKRISDDQFILKTILSKKRVSILLFQLPQRRYCIELFILLNICDAASNLSTFMCFLKSRLN